MSKSPWIKILVFLLGFAPLSPQDACAYVDPGSGSILLQLILGGVAGIGVVAKLYWQRLKTTMLHLFQRE